MHTQFLSLPATLLTIAALSACATPVQGVDDLVAGAHTTPSSCSAELVGRNPAGPDELDSSEIRIVNWNIEKGDDPRWATDLRNLHETADLYVFQEAPLKSAVWNETTVDRHHAFAPGYRTRRALTGVMTVSNTTPLTQCNLVAVEPWIRSPKATVITEYGLTDTDETLLVVNIHVVNFTFGMRAFIEQIAQAKTVIDEHHGPIVLLGDFNTWRSGRAELLGEMAADAGLQVTVFEEDHRKRFFGLPLDHIYTRGLEVIDATTTLVDSSDHNPMSARFRL
ncbi:MAG: endonuclease/exonuclease/phosphatase family protein [Woeseiaceae bacterium]